MGTRRSRLRRATLGALVAAACSDPPPEAISTTGEPDSSSSTGAGATDDLGTGPILGDTTTSGPPLDEGSSSSSSSGASTSDTSTGDGTSTSTAGSSDDDTGEPQPLCGDGQVAAEELCHLLGPAILVAPAPGRLALDDVDQDGDVDLVLANALSPMVVVLWGVGDGNFIAPQLLLLAGAVVDDLALVDLSDDGAPDLVVTDRLGSRVVTYANDGAGDLFFAGQYPAELAPVRLVAGELDGDGVPDLVALAATSAAVMHGNGLAGVIPVQQVMLPSGPHTPGLFDVNGDGQLDFVTVNQAGGNATSRLNMGGTMAPGIDHDTAATPTGLAMGDIDEDGDLDLVLAHTSADDLGVLLGDGLGVLGAETLLDVADDPRAVALADLDSDGHLDLAVTHGAPGMLMLHAGLGDGTFDVGVSLPLGGPADLYVTELNGDGVPDLVITRPADSSVQALVSDP
jgi:FG-GAP-like repeat